jgi:hypothetical protein
MLKMSLQPESGAAPALEIADADLQPAGAQLSRVSGGIELRLPAGATTDHAQRLLRAIVVRQEQPLTKPLSLVVQIVGSGGELLSEARATVQAEEVEETPSLASAAGN